MNQPNRPKGPPGPVEAQETLGTPGDGLSGSGLPAMAALTLEAPEALTQEDLDARANVGFALDLEPFLPGPAVGSEVVLLETDPEAARRLGVRAEAVAEGSVPPGAPPVGEPGAAMSPAPPDVGPVPPAALPQALAPQDVPDVDVEPVLEPPPAMDSFQPPPAPRAPVTPPLDLQASPVWMPPPPPPAPPPPPGYAPPAAAQPWNTPMPAVPPVAAALGAVGPPAPLLQDAHRRSAGPQAAVGPGVRVYPQAWAWAGLGLAPQFGGSSGRPATRPMPERGAPQKAPMEDLLDLAAVGKGADGVTEMLLMFKEDVLRGLTATLRLEKEGMRAHFVAPDETVRRYVESTAEDLLARMRRRGLKVAGWTVVVGG